VEDTSPSEDSCEDEDAEDYGKEANALDEE